jgi:hypothetical protein
MSKESDIKDHEPRHRQTYARLYDAMHPESIDELAKVIRDRYPQVVTATHKRRCHWAEDGICLDVKCDQKQCDDAQDVIVLGLKKTS